MSNDLNQCSFIGRLGKDVELRPIGDSSVANFTIACGWKSKDKEGVEWINVSAFGKLADICAQYLVKGSQIYVSGKMKTDKYTKDRVERYSTKIVADNVQFLSKANTQQEAPAQQEEHSYATDENIPF